VPSTDLIFDHVYSEQHPLMDAQKQWGGFAYYEAGLGVPSDTEELPLAKCFNAGLRSSPTILRCC
jgi:hypothetical protein